MVTFQDVKMESDMFHIEMEMEYDKGADESLQGNKNKKDCTMWI